MRAGGPQVTAIGDDHALLTAAVRAAGALSLEFFRSDSRSWSKGPGQPVGEADLAVDRHLRAALLDARPGYGWQSEESDAVAGTDPARRRWVVDPIDGTRAFLKGRDEFALSVALVAGARPVAAVVYNPARDEFFDAVADGGAWLNGAAISVASAAALAGAEVLVSRTELKELDWPDLLGDCVTTPMSSIAYRLALVAAGRADAVVTLRGKSDWDIAAGHLLAAEAGAAVTLADGGPIGYDPPGTRHPTLIAANPALNSLLVRRLSRELSACKGAW